ncbi:NAD-dependent epimerase/dehydratase family protein [Aeromonas caviae]
MESNTALVLGATGGIGGEMARQLRDAGWTVRALRRSGEQQIERRDAMNREDVLAAAEGCSVIVHAVNPPGYRRWGELVLPMLDNTIAAAHANGATIVLPGTVYNYGPSSFPTLHEDSPQQPITRKGSIRVEMEQRLKQASSQNCRVLLVRARDFFGPKLGSSWFSQGMLKPGQPVKSISVPNAPGMGHQWSYLPDVVRTMVELLQLRSTLDPFAAFHTAGHWDADGTQLAEAICRVVVKRGGVKPKVRAFPWWLTVLAAPFVPTLRELCQMRYLWSTRVKMSNAKLVSTLGHEPHTPLDEAVEAALEGMGCLQTTPVRKLSTVNSDG